MKEYFISYCFYLGVIFAMLIGFGFGFYVLVKSGWNHLSAKFGTYAFLPRFIGTPVHELGHLIFAVLTGAKIKDVKLFPKISVRLRNSGGGHVKFIPRKGIIGSISCFFCGIGPMIFCPLVIVVLMHIFVPELYEGMKTIYQDTNLLNQQNFIQSLQSIITGFFGSFHFYMFEEWNFYIFLILAIPIANECILSSADVKSAGRGFFALLLILTGLGVLLSLIPFLAVPVISWLAKSASMLLCVLCLGLVFNLIHWGLGAIIHFLF